MGILHTPFRIVTFLTLSAPLCAQTSKGTVTGIVTDATGAAMANASIHLTNQATNVKRESVTNESGLYRFDAVDLGEYSVQVKAPGFSSFIKRSVPVLGGQTASVDVRLEVGETQQTVEVTAETDALLQFEAPLRGGNFSSQTASQLPLSNRRVTSMAFVLPGVSTNRFGAGSTNFNNFVINGARQRSNNFMIDGTENNDISVTGEGLTITNPDAVAEVHIQTSNFDAEFGRSGGGVINVITKSGGNDTHGTLHYILDSTYDDAISNTQSLSRAIRERGRPAFGIEHWWGGTAGGRIRRDRTFYFASFQEQRQRQNLVHNVVTLTATGRATLNALYPRGSNRNVDLYNDLTNGAVGEGNPFNVALGNGRPDVQFGNAITTSNLLLVDRQIISRIDHRLTDRDQLAGRFIIQNQTSPGGAFRNVFPGFYTSSQTRNQNLSITETHVFRPTITNELRMNYNRLAPNFPADAANPLALQTPQFQVAGGISSFGLTGSAPQGRTGNNYSLQDTLTVIRGAHSIRTGADILVQRSRQFAPIFERGFMDYRAGGGFTAFANFVDDFGGSDGVAQRDFGSAAYYPNLKRTAFFLQDRWRATQSLTLTLGVRYEYFGVPMNSLFKSSWSGLFNVNPTSFTGPFSQRSEVKPDRNNWSPSAGINYSPSVRSGWLGRLAGDRKTVIRAGYQIGYDSFFNNIASNAQTTTPNIISTAVNSVITASTPRGLPNALRALPSSPRPPDALDLQNLVAGNLVNPYMQRWSFGIQREMRAQWLVDVSYVGSKGTRLFLNEELNPLVTQALRIVPATAAPIPASRLSGRLDNLQGERVIRTNGGSSNFHSLQASASRRLSKGFLMTAAYTWAKMIDFNSDLFGIAQTNARSVAAVPTILGGMPAERGLSMFDRRHRAVFTWVYELPFYRQQNGWVGRLAGGWQMSGFTTFESGVPVTVSNGLDADGLGGNGDRPLFNPNGAPKTRAVPDRSSPTGFINPDLPGRPPMDASTARYIGLPAHDGRPTPLPTGNTGRNTESLPGINNWNATLQKNIRINERFRTELRVEAFNVFNKPQYGTPSASPFGVNQQGVSASTINSPAGQFLQPQFADGGGRVLRYQWRLVF